MKKLIIFLLFCLVPVLSCAHLKEHDPEKAQVQEHSEKDEKEQAKVEEHLVDCGQIIDKVLAKYASCKTFQCKSRLAYKTYNIDLPKGKKENLKFDNLVDFEISFSRPDMVRADFTERRNGKNTLPDTTSSLYTKSGEYHLFYYRDALIPEDKILNYSTLKELADRWRIYPYSPMYFLTRLFFGNSEYLKDGQYTCKLLGSETIDGKECWKIEITDVVTSWIDKESYAVIKIERDRTSDENLNTGLENVVMYTDISFDKPLSKKAFVFNGKTGVPEYEDFIVMGNKMNAKVKMIRSQGEVMLPVRAAAEQLGYSFIYNKALGNAAIVKGDDKIIILVGQSGSTKNEKPLNLSTLPISDEDDILVPADFFPKVFDKNVLVTSKKAEICDEVMHGDDDAKLYLKEKSQFYIKLAGESKNERKHWVYKPAEGIKQLDKNVEITAVEKMDVWYSGENDTRYEKMQYAEAAGRPRVWAMEAEKPGKYVILFVESSDVSTSEEIITYNITVTE